MNDKPQAGLLVTLAAAPIMVVCCLGPILFASFFGSIFAWFAGLDPVVYFGIVLVGATLLVVQLKRRKRTAVQRGEQALANPADPSVGKNAVAGSAKSK